ncbi:MAG: DNA/RNA nuclease SfsA [Defluviitaleaceae bacterium]|nr:DNA/RNA nuclease SfsA [Defluviitaleaceae bacterium]
MTYNDIHEGIFLSRPNRFIAEVEVYEQVHKCHVKNTGRCKELLVPGAKVYVNRSDKMERVTKFDLISVWKEERLINMDSQAPNKVFLEYLKSGQHLRGITFIKPEAKYGNSRFDFYVEAEGPQSPGKRKIFIEIKGVTLEIGGAAFFPDAPTERGVRHLKELTRLSHEGYEAHVVFVIKMKGITHFSPNNTTHPAFGAALTLAKEAGVKVIALDCNVMPNSLVIDNPVSVIL